MAPHIWKLRQGPEKPGGGTVMVHAMESRDEGRGRLKGGSGGLGCGAGSG